ncbi:MAG: hypothetical protein PHY43_11050 [Verrucomicrobiales bacterium]|nr:hypothetical protein [Verrucomicrobiales bacterium]
MKKFISLMLAALPLILTSCTTPPPPLVFHNTDSTALVIKSLDSGTCQMLQPTASAPGDNRQILTKAESLPQHQTAVVILENYTERRMGEQFRDRCTPLFIALRGLKYEHIIFLQGNNVSDPNGLIILAEYF